jgi:hypothetical protein
MRLQDRLPDGVTVEGKFYRLDFDFRNVLRMMDVLADKELMPGAKAYNAVKCLTKRPKNVFRVLEAVEALLFDRKPKKDAQKVTDFAQDAGMIRAAFRQAYGIDLYRDKLHWIEFAELLNAIPEGSRYSEVVGIRARPLPAPTKYNVEERKWLIKAKADVALELTDEEREQKYNKDVKNVFAVLMGMIDKGSGNNGE